MHNPSIRLRFGLILEAYGRGCGAYLKALNRQVEALDKLTKLSETLKMERIEREVGTIWFSEFLLNGQPFTHL